ncbi:hypothetical protein P0D88_30405 [Paraburkholderia sp. RL18-103-BIB-C]
MSIVNAGGEAFGKSATLELQSKKRDNFVSPGCVSEHLPRWAGPAV